MRQLLLFLSLFASGAANAASESEAIIAAMRLGQQSGYTWVTTIEDDLRTYDVRGAVDANGYTHVRMPVVENVRRRLGRNAPDAIMDVVFRGNTRCVIALEDGWKTPDELPRVRDRGFDDGGIPGAAFTLGVPRTFGAAGSLGSSVSHVPASAFEKHPAAVYDTLRLAISHPHEDLAVIVSSYTELSVDGHVTTGTLNELGAQLLLVRDGQEDVEPVAAAGTFKLWVQNGIVTKYQVQLEGVLAVKRRNVMVTQRATTSLANIGTTRVEVPLEAAAKLRD